MVHEKLTFMSPYKDIDKISLVCTFISLLKLFDYPSKTPGDDND